MIFFRKHIVGFAGLLFSGILTVQSAQASQLSVFPSATNANTIGQVITVDIVIFDLGTGTAPSVGAFDIDVAFDNTLLGLDSVTFGNGLDLGLFGSLQFITDFGNSVEVDEASFEFESDLDNFQPDSFTLFTLDFLVLADGVSNLDLTALSIADASGLSAIVPTAINNGVVNIKSGSSSPVLEPATFALLVIGLAGIRMTVISRG